MDYIELKNMVFHARHGVSEQEKKVGNTFTVSLKLYLNLNAAGQSDRLEETLNYAEVFEIVKKEMAIPSCLLEHIASRIIQAVKQTFPQIAKIRIRLAKLRPPVCGEMEEAAVVIKLQYPEELVLETITKAETIYQVYDVFLSRWLEREY